MYISLERHNLALHPKAAEFKQRHYPHLDTAPSEPLKCGIIGAGPAGLFTAMLLKSLNIDYEILEASSRCGGRVYTHYFDRMFPPKAENESEADFNQRKLEAAKKKTDLEAKKKLAKRDFNYFDVGAMRFPKPKSTGPCNKQPNLLWKLFDYAGLKEIEGDRGEIIKYYMKSENSLGLDNSFRFYNNVSIKKCDMNAAGNNNKGGNSTDNDHHSLSQEKGGPIPQKYLNFKYKEFTGIEALVRDTLDPFKEALKADLNNGWENLMRFDDLSMRGYLMQIKRYPYFVTHWMETLSGGTGAYDFGFTGAVLGSMQFAHPQETDLEWKCIKGGSTVLIDKMVEDVIHNRVTGNDERILTNSFVRGIEMATKSIGNNEMIVKGSGVGDRRYSHVINTAPLSCQRTMELEGALLTSSQKQAIRALNYDASEKIAIKFKSRWWQASQATNDANGPRGLDITGGVSFTDRPCRMFVYPSYGIDDKDGNEGAVLIVSYSWAQDSNSLSSLMYRKHGPNQDISKEDKALEEVLLDIVYSDLAKVHGGEPKWYRDNTATDDENNLMYYAFNWYSNPYSNGGMARFGPGQYSQLATEMTMPAAYGRLWFAGEATSTEHGWILGALNSAWRVVYQICYKESLGGGATKVTMEKNMKELVENWPIPWNDEGLEDIKTQVRRGMHKSAMVLTPDKYETQKRLRLSSRSIY